MIVQSEHPFYIEVMIRYMCRRDTDLQSTQSGSSGFKQLIRIIKRVSPQYAFYRSLKKRLLWNMSHFGAQDISRLIYI